MQRRLVAWLPILLLSATTLTAQQPRVVPLQVTGDAQARFSMVILGDGYTAAELPKFRSDVERHLNILWSIEPFRSYRSYFNVYAVEVVSPESGITCDPDRPAQRRTALGLHFDGGCENRNARGVLVGNDTVVRQLARLATPHYNQILIIANTDTYGGIGGSLATTTASNAISPLITPHELGHSLGRLQDEYTYRNRGVRGGFYTAEEPPSVHHTVLTEAQMREQQQKWWRWLGEESEAGGVIGRYEGGLYSAGGVWRPSRHSMMISLGYPFDQVSRERMVSRISSFTQLIASSTPTDAPVARTQVVWIETPSPVYHELRVTWELDGRAIPQTDSVQLRQLDLAQLQLPAGEHTLTVRVVDPTPFVRDPGIRDSVLTATRSWKVGAGSVRAASVPAAFTTTTATDRPVGGTDVVYAHTAQPGDRVLPVTWRLDGRALPLPPHARTVNLGALQLAPGTHTLEATVADSAGGAQQTLRWTIDNTMPQVQATITADAIIATTQSDGAPHYFVRDSFFLRLDPTDDQAGHVVGEFRVNGDGWHNYYGWPDAPAGTPFRFTPRGTVIKELVYGSLGAEGLSPQPWEAREPGWGTHRIEFHAIDAAGNISAARELRVTLMPSPQCTRTISGTHKGDVVFDAGVLCVRDGTVRGTVTVRNGASLYLLRSTIEKDLLVSGAQVVELLHSTVKGNAQVANARYGPVLYDSQVRGRLTF